MATNCIRLLTNNFVGKKGTQLAYCSLRSDNSSVMHFANILPRSLRTGKTTRTSTLFSSSTVAPWRKTESWNHSVRQFSQQSARNSSGANHAAIWTVERALSVALLGVVPLGIMFPSQVGNTLMAVTIVMHQHWGLEAIVTDYVRPNLVGKTVPKLAHLLLLFVSAATFGGLLYFNYNDMGIAAVIRKIWMTKAKE